MAKASRRLRLLRVEGLALEERGAQHARQHLAATEDVVAKVAARAVGEVGVLRGAGEATRRARGRHAPRRLCRWR